ncbi:MAG: hypothetical protein RL062_1101 [Bacteroidota bacterium]|jgi:hypothetical protein
MELLLSWSDIWKQFAPIIMAIIILSALGLIGKLALFSKANQPYWAAFVPLLDVVITMRIVGRPDRHALLLLVPVYNIYFVFKVCIELADSFGKTTTIDHVLACVFNVLYILNLSLAYSVEYKGPAYSASPSLFSNPTSVA